jgi:hypothetical protein
VLWCPCPRIEEVGFPPFTPSAASPLRVIHAPTESNGKRLKIPGPIKNLGIWKRGRGKDTPSFRPSHSSISFFGCPQIWHSSICPYVHIVMYCLGEEYIIKLFSQKFPPLSAFWFTRVNHGRKNMEKSCPE